MGKAPLGPWSPAARAVLLCSSGFALASCGKVSDVTPTASAQGVPAAANVESATASPAAGPSLENANYSAALKSVGPCKKDQACGVEVIVEAKGDYHINDKYPYRFKWEDPPPSGLKYPKPIIGKEDGTMNEHKVVLRAPFVSASPGDKKVAGTLSLSVCSAANCLMDKQQLELSVKVE